MLRHRRHVGVRSSTALLTAVIPLALPLLDTGALPIVGVVAALAISATVVDVSPFSTNGALVLANAQNIDRRVFYRQLLLNAGIVVVLAPAYAGSPSSSHPNSYT